ncbi:uncharacterized protein LOC122388924 [Amphibalanus amphitrite]|uniref:uncharacterized protein LOC122388924 n=1 Tax=Amphibalanus amphitrite TaxID=1232801 RepID=UPI001C91BA93|nr:uncharacterized protein LOC122388924 [Amphibalanus amphitrite]
MHQTSVKRTFRPAPNDSPQWTLVLSSKSPMDSCDRTAPPSPHPTLLPSPVPRHVCDPPNTHLLPQEIGYVAETDGMKRTPPDPVATPYSATPRLSTAVPSYSVHSTNEAPCSRPAWQHGAVSDPGRPAHGAGERCLRAIVTAPPPTARPDRPTDRPALADWDTELLGIHSLGSCDSRSAIPARPSSVTAQNAFRTASCGSVSKLNVTDSRCRLRLHLGSPRYRSLRASDRLGGDKTSRVAKISVSEGV